MEDKIQLEKLQLKSEPCHMDDEVVIYTTMGIHHPDKPMGHKCTIARLPCGDTRNPDDSKYQIASLFRAAPDLLAALKDFVNMFEQVYGCCNSHEEMDSREECCCICYIYDQAKDAISKAEEAENN